jgi:hypothetical protein
MPGDACITVGCDPSKGGCVFTPLPDGTLAPGAPQVPGDCSSLLCIGGVTTLAVNDGDLPSSPSPCLLATCTSGVPALVPFPAGTPCPGGTCDGTGSCGGCITDSDCPGVAAECQHPVCTKGACTQWFAPGGASTSTQTTGDCAKLICDGAGEVLQLYDPTDYADDGNKCTAEFCQGLYVTVHVSMPDGTACGANHVCIAGACQ